MDDQDPDKSLSPDKKKSTGVNRNNVSVDIDKIPTSAKKVEAAKIIKKDTDPFVISPISSPRTALGKDAA